MDTGAGKLESVVTYKEKPKGVLAVVATVQAVRQDIVTNEIRAMLFSTGQARVR